MVGSFDDFEKAISDLEAQVERVKRLTREQGVDRGPEIAQLEAQVRRLLHEFYAHPSAWDRTRIARHPRRPFMLDFARLAFEGFTELHGDRGFADDGAMIGGIAQLQGQWVTVIGQQKGRDAQERFKRNFGYAKPEGYRKALRLIRLSEKFNRPVICLIDTPAADPSVSSEERGISEAIARNIREMFLIRVPIICAITGEGGSGGALGIGVGDRVLMLEHSIYSVIPPEGCAAILWKDAERAVDAAEALKLTAQHALEVGAVDEVLPEPLGGAHRDLDGTAKSLQEALVRHLREVQALSVPDRLEARYQRFRRMARFIETSPNGGA
jgi:acetyl-CoA carboxylase carboxyl transferase subunit alpha